MLKKLTEYKVLKGTITCLTGLRIGGSKETIEIGTVENPIIRHPLTGLPYIPGSSLKGKMRSLLEQKYGIVEDNGEPSHSLTAPVCRVFGPHMFDPKRTPINQHPGPTRILVRDAFLPEEEVKKLESQKKSFVTEIKTENLVNRKTGTAEHPRTQERVPAGTRFNFEIAVRIFDGDDEKQTLDLIKEGLRLLEQDYLGASGSRGYGKVKIDLEQ